MKRGIVRFFAVVIVFFCLVLTVQAGNFKNVVVFGDSLSDSGNVYAFTNGAYPPVPYQGCFSDGPVWVEYLVKYLGISGDFCNYAHGGATTGLTNTEGNPTGFRTQISAYTALLTASAAFPTAFPQPEESLFVLWIGGNDFLSLTPGDTDAAMAAVTNAVGNIRSGMDQLVSEGAVTFMVVNLPDLGIIPRMNQDATIAAGGTGLSSLFNNSLEGMLVGFEDAHPEVEIIRLDTFSILHTIVADPETYGFDNVTDVKFDKTDGSVATGRYLFWDDIHPTTITHKILAHQAAFLLEGDCPGVARFDNKLNLTVPYAGLGTAGYGFRLDYCADPAADPDGYYWKLDLSTVTAQ